MFWPSIDCYCVQAESRWVYATDFDSDYWYPKKSTAGDYQIAIDIFGIKLSSKFMSSLLATSNLDTSCRQR